MSSALLDDEAEFLQYRQSVSNRPPRIAPATRSDFLLDIDEDNLAYRVWVLTAYHCSSPPPQASLCSLEDKEFKEYCLGVGYSPCDAPKISSKGSGYSGLTICYPLFGAGSPGVFCRCTSCSRREYVQSTVDALLILST